MAYPPELKASIQARLVGDTARSIPEVAQQAGISESTLYLWRQQAHRQSWSMKERAMRPDDKSPAEKLRLVQASAGLEGDELGAFLRREGIQDADLEAWRMQMLKALGPALSAPMTAKQRALGKKVARLEKEVRRKDRALAEAAALLVLQKKVQQLWVDEDDDTP